VKLINHPSVMEQCLPGLNHQLKTRKESLSANRACLKTPQVQTQWLKVSPLSTRLEWILLVVLFQGANYNNSEPWRCIYS